MKLTDMTLQKLLAPESGAKIYSDDILPSFGVKVRHGGSKTFILTVGRERKRITIGRYPLISLAEARRQAQAILRDRELGIIHKPSPTLRAVKDEYLARRDDEVRAATRQGDTYLFKHFDGLLSRKLEDITPGAIEAIIDNLDAPSTRRNAFVRISGLFSYAIRRGYMDRSPIQPLRMPPDQTPRHRVLTRDELRKVLTCARMLRIAGDQYGAIVELLIYTGQRRQQIGGLTRKMVDFDTQTMTWPEELMKSGKRHTVPFGPLTRIALETRPIGSGELYFPSRVGEPFCAWSYHFRKFTREVGFSDWVIHDLRRTLATCWQDLGIEIATTEKMLSHSSITGGLVGVYQRSTYLEQMRGAVLRWDDYLQTLLSNGRA